MDGRLRLSSCAFVFLPLTFVSRAARVFSYHLSPFSRAPPLPQAFPTADLTLVDTVWAQARANFAAACTIMTSLRNNGHHTRKEGEGEGEGEGAESGGLRMEDPRVWPSVEEVWGEGGKEGGTEIGWEHVLLSTRGEQWVLLGEGEAEEEDEGEDEGEEESMTYRSVLMSNLMEMEGGEEWPAAPPRRTFPSLSSLGTRKKVRRREEDVMGGEEGGFLEEYELQKAVGVRTRRSMGRKRLTETGKRRMAAKLQARRAPRAAGEEGEDGVEVW